MPLRATLLAFLFLPICLAPAQAANMTWTGATSTNWLTGTNWTTGLPTIADNAFINTSGANAPVVSLSGAVAAQVTLGTTSGSNGTLTVNGGTLSSTSGTIASAAGSTATVTVTGSGAQWTNSAGVAVGGKGAGTLVVSDKASVSGTNIVVGANGGASGTLRVESGGTVTGAISIGNLPTSTGTATVTGAGSQWNSSSTSTAYVGQNGTGALTISNGGAVSSGVIIIGNNATSVGTVRVEGGGTLTTATGNATLGTAAGANGQATITGAGSTWNITKGTLQIGYSGTGQVTIADQGSVIVGANVYVTSGSSLRVESKGSLTSLTGNIGSITASPGTAVVTGAGTTWTSTGALSVGSIGSTGTGTLTISDQAEVKAGSTSISTSSSATGILTVTGNGSKLTNTAGLTVGKVGTGTLTLTDKGAASATGVVIGSDNGSIGTLKIEQGGTLTGTSGGIANSATATGSATVTGVDSKWTSSGALTIGSSGKGTLTVSDKGAVSAGGITVGKSNLSSGTVDVLSGGTLSGTTGMIGEGAGSTGAVTISGTDSKWTNSSTLIVGNYGTGKLTVSNNGQVSAGGLNVGYYSPSNNEVRVESGGTFSTGSAKLGREKGAKGSVTVTGNGSRWTATGQMDIGLYGTGALTISDSGTVGADDIYLGTYSGASGTLLIDSGGVLNNANSYVGHGAGASGTATVSGKGSAWNNSGYLYVGNNGVGSLLVEKGGSVTSNVGKIVGASSVTVSGNGSKWEVGTDLTIGNTSKLSISDHGFVSANWISVGHWTGQNGALEITGGGALSTGSGSIGYYDATSTGTVTVTGAGSTWTSTGDLSVGRNGKGNLTISDQGQVEARNIILGNAVNPTPGAGGTVTVTGAGSKLAATDALFVGNTTSGILTLSNGGEASAPVTYVAKSGTSTGTINIGAASGSAAATSGILNTQSLTFGAGNGTLVFNHTDSDYLFAPDMTGKGIIKAENGRTVLKGESSGFTGNTAISSGATLQIGDGGTSGSFGGAILADGSLVFDRRDDTSFDGAISGSGSLTKNGAGTLELTGDSTAFTGATTLAQGGLEVNGALAGSTVTAMGGTILSGSGTVGGIVAQSGSTIAPGSGPGSAPANGIGTLKVTGDYHQLSGSVYAAEVKPGTSLADLISVDGTATLESGAILDVSKVTAGDYGINDVYTVLSAAGGVSGTFTVTGDTAISNFYELQAFYDANAAYLKAAQIRDFADAGWTPNQIATADGLNSLPLGNEVHDAIAVLTSDEEARQAFDLLSGEIHASIAGALTEEAGLLRKAAIDRLRCRDQQAPRAATQQGSCSGGAVWAQGYGASGSTDGDGNAARLSNDMKGFIIGADMLTAEGWRLGVLGAYDRAEHDVSRRNSSGVSESYSLGLYGGTQWNKLGLRLGGAYSWNDVQTERDVAFSGFSDHLSADYNSGTAQLFGELAYRIDAGPASFEPFAGLAYVSVDTGSFTEQGGSAALTSEDTDTGVTFSMLGLRASADFALGDFILTASGAAAWRHGWGDITPEMGFAFAGSDAFMIRGVPIAQDAAAIEAGLTAGTEEGASFGLFYDGQFGGGVESQGLRGSLVLPF